MFDGTDDSPGAFESGGICFGLWRDLQDTYLLYLRDAMGRATELMDPFEMAYKNTDWTPFEHLPLFKAANRMNAYNTYLLLEHEAIK